MLQNHRFRGVGVLDPAVATVSRPWFPVASGLVFYVSSGHPASGHTCFTVPFGTPRIESPEAPPGDLVRIWRFCDQCCKIDFYKKIIYFFPFFLGSHLGSQARATLPIPRGPKSVIHTTGRQGSLVKHVRSEASKISVLATPQNTRQINRF